MQVPFTLTTDRARQIGLVVLQADETIERDMRRLMPAEAELIVSRVPSAPHVTPETLAAMEQELARAAELFPLAARFEAIGYGCTSGTAQIGAARVAQAIRAGAATPAVTEPLSALIAACRHLGLRRIGLLSPYIESVSDRLRAALAQAGVEVSAFATFNESEEEKVVRISADAILSAGEALAASGQMDGLFLSCTNLRTLEVIAPLEDRIGLPVLASNQVLAWHLVRLAGLAPAPGCPGLLWKAER